MLRSIACVAIGSVWGEQLWLEDFLGFQPRVVKLKLTMNHPRKNSRLTWEECGPCPIFASYAICLTTEEKHVKTSVRLAEKVPVGTIRYVHVHLADTQDELPILIPPY